MEYLNNLKDIYWDIKIFLMILTDKVMNIILYISW